jgi:hypothetical protein
MTASEWIAKFSILVPLVTGLLLWRRSGYAGRWLTRYVCVVVTLEVLVEVGKHVWPTRAPIIHLWTWLEFGVIALLYAHLLKSSRYIPLLALAFYGAAVVLAVTVEGWLAYPQLLISVENAVVIILAGTWFVHSLIAEPRPNIHLSFGFWLAASHLVYFAGTFTIFTMVNYLLANPGGLMPQAWIFHSWLLVAMYGGYAVAIWVDGIYGNPSENDLPANRGQEARAKSP